MKRLAALILAAACSLPVHADNPVTGYLKNAGKQTGTHYDLMLPAPPGFAAAQVRLDVSTGNEIICKLYRVSTDHLETMVFYDANADGITDDAYVTQGKTLGELSDHLTQVTQTEEHIALYADIFNLLQRRSHMQPFINDIMTNATTQDRISQLRQGQLYTTTKQGVEISYDSSAGEERVICTISTPTEHRILLDRSADGVVDEVYVGRGADQKETDIDLSRNAIARNNQVSAIHQHEYDLLKR